MWKWSKGKDGRKSITGCICDNSLKEIPGSAILVYFPEDHIADTAEGPCHFASDKDLLEFVQKLGTKFGPWKSKAFDKPIPPSKGGKEVDRKKPPFGPTDITGGGII